MSDSLIQPVIEPAPIGPPRLVSPPLLLVFACCLACLTSFFALLSVVPLDATRAGGSGSAGAANAALLFATVAGELVTPGIVARLGVRWALAAGLLALGLPALALAGPVSLAVILAICVVRGLGFGVAVVVMAALAAGLVPPERRGEGLGLYGVVAGAPAVVALPLGVWLAGQVGSRPVYVAGAAAALAGLALVPLLPGRALATERSGAVVAVLRAPRLVRPAAAFATTTMAAGVVVTFLPLTVPRPALALVAPALLVQSAAAMLTRWGAGRLGDRHGPARLFGPAVLAAGAGIAALALSASPVAVLGGMALFGAGFGAAQNASLALMLNRARRSEYGSVSAVWNLAYDAGLGLGAAGFGALAAVTGYPAAFAVTAGIVLAAAVPAWLDREARAKRLQR